MNPIKFVDAKSIGLLQNNDIGKIRGGQTSPCSLSLRITSLHVSILYFTDK